MYEELRKKRKELRLPIWRDMTNTDRHYAKGLTVDKLIARRAAKLLRRSGEHGSIDRTRPYKRHKFIPLPYRTRDLHTKKSND
jgi:hypothetical protein